MSIQIAVWWNGSVSCNFDIDAIVFKSSASRKLMLFTSFIISSQLAKHSPWHRRFLLTCQRPWQLWHTEKYENALPCAGSHQPTWTRAGRQAIKAGLALKTINRGGITRPKPLLTSKGNRHLAFQSEPGTSFRMFLCQTVAGQSFR